MYDALENILLLEMSVEMQDDIDNFDGSIIDDVEEIYAERQQFRGGLF